MSDSIRTHGISKRDHRDAQKISVHTHVQSGVILIDILRYIKPLPHARSFPLLQSSSETGRQVSDSWKNTCDIKIISYRNDPGQVFPWIITIHQQANNTSRWMPYAPSIASFLSPFFFNILKKHLPATYTYNIHSSIHHLIQTRAAIHTSTFISVFIVLSFYIPPRQSTLSLCMHDKFRIWSFGLEDG